MLFHIRQASGHTIGFLTAVCLLSAIAAAQAQLPNSDLSRIHPPFGRAGESVIVTLYGQNLEHLRDLQFTHSGIKAEPVRKPAPEFLKKPYPEGTKFTIKIGKNVPPGIYEARATGFFGISTARPFVVVAADSEEVNEASDNSVREKAMALKLDHTVFGTAPDRGVDWFKFHAEEGRRLLIQCLAERIDSRLDGLLILYDSKGNELDRNRQHFNRDPFLDFTAPETGEYFISLAHIIYRGNSESFYRLTVSTKPQIDAIFPPAAEPGKKTRFTIFGRNLPGGSTGEGFTLNGRRLETVTTEIEMPKEPATPRAFHPGQPRQGMLRGYDYRYEGSNPFRIGFATAPVVPEDAKTESQTITVPAEIVGRFDQPNDEDAYRFTATKGVTYWLETIADQAGVSIDTAIDVYQLSKDGRKLIVSNDDPPSFFGQDNLDTIHFDTVDAAASFTAEADGEYEVGIRNQFGSGNVAHIYRLAIREAAPDFDVITASERPLPTNRTGYSVTPLLRRNGRWPIRVVVPRRDGFEGDIMVTASGLPTGVQVTPLALTGKKDQGLLILSAEADARNWAGDIRVTGSAEINGKRVIRQARFATLVWGHVFADSIRVRSRLTQRVPLGVTEHETAPTIIKPGKHEFSVKLGDKLDIPVALIDNGQRKGSLTVQPHGLYGMRSYPKVNIAEKDSKGTLSIDFKTRSSFNVQPGTYQFTLMGIGTTRYRYAEAAARELAADVAELEKILARLKSEAKAAADAVKAEEENASKAREASDKVRRAEKELSELKALARKAADRAKEKTEKFAAWSDPITISVLPKD